MCSNVKRSFIGNNHMPETSQMSIKEWMGKLRFVHTWNTTTEKKKGIIATSYHCEFWNNYSEWNMLNKKITYYMSQFIIYKILVQWKLIYKWQKANTLCMDRRLAWETRIGRRDFKKVYENIWGQCIYSLPWFWW